MKGVFIFCVLVLCAALSRPALAQVASSTTLVGTVTDSSGAVIPGVSVIAVQDATKVAYKGRTMWPFSKRTVPPTFGGQRRVELI